MSFEHQDKINVSGIELTMTNPQERLSMGGPYTANLYIGTEFISVDGVCDNFVFQEDTELLFFVKYHQINRYKYFTINFYNIRKKCLFEFNREFDMVHLGAFLNKTQLYIYRAFHDKFESLKRIFNLDEEDFTQLS